MRWRPTRRGPTRIAAPAWLNVDAAVAMTRPLSVCRMQQLVREPESGRQQADRRSADRRFVQD